MRHLKPRCTAKELQKAVTERQQVQRNVAHTELREAVANILFPFEILYENAEYGPAKIPFLGPQKFYCSPDYMTSCMKDPVFPKAWGSYKMKSNPKYPDVYPPLPWWRIFSENAKRNSALMDNIIQKYSSYLDSDTLVAVHDVQSDDFFRLRLVRLGDLIDANGDMPISRAFESPRGYSDYEAFVDKVAALMRKVSDGKSRWCNPANAQDDVGPLGKS